MSDHAYRLLLMKRALARSDAELFGQRPPYLEVAGLYVSPCRGDALHDMGPWWMGQPRRMISEGMDAVWPVNGPANASAEKCLKNGDPLKRIRVLTLP